MTLKWEKIDCEMAEKNFLGGPAVGQMLRAKVPGGWLIQFTLGVGGFFYPDPEHLWDGSSLP